jgi:hypothetical protein
MPLAQNSNHTHPVRDLGRASAYVYPSPGYVPWRHVMYYYRSCSEQKYYIYMAATPYNGALSRFGLGRSR